MAKKKKAAPKSQAVNKMSKPNNDVLAWGGCLGTIIWPPDLDPPSKDKHHNSIRHVFVTDIEAPGGEVNTWLDGWLLERLIKKDTRINGLLSHAFQGDKYRGTRSLPRLLAGEVMRVFEEEYLVYVMERLELAMPVIVEYLLARYADEKLNPEEYE